ncbi:hypothetical protein TTHERM_00128550 (macronuclear) [Tetrahymena thermophila SB210]|uniref:Uncharacterized protein n=1 Tax=Tetrahymena thermophila (strain SB210) TaxID=312017 RepID=I7MJ93_TETTS|nr:hypothetical protein TTHERM_00128550 [Tetrahymena thermophila SB210]EAR96091.1 hypothetical protein TTHERM_00128550 [Tetrahymena thermophila SB210]|eukprot:XP_001016336.1 hypothetical protein TTHERM_00128550 [Tetrahymena thermophila SB210]
MTEISFFLNQKRGKARNRGYKFNLRQDSVLSWTGQVSQNLSQQIKQTQYQSYYHK